MVPSGITATASAVMPMPRLLYTIMVGELISPVASAHCVSNLSAPWIRKPA